MQTRSLVSQLIRRAVLRGLVVIRIDSGEARQAGAALSERVETASATPLGPSTDSLLHVTQPVLRTHFTCVVTQLHPLRHYTSDPACTHLLISSRLCYRERFVNRGCMRRQSMMVGRNEVKDGLRQREQNAQSDRRG